MLENFFAIDKCIFEQHLGLSSNFWNQLSTEILQKFDLPSYRAATQLLKTDTKPKKGKMNQYFIMFYSKVFQTGMFYATTSTFGSSKISKSGSLSSLNRFEIDKRYELHAIKVIMEKIASHTEWLQDADISEVLDTRTKSEKVLVKVDHVFSALGITNMNNVNSLKDHFIPYLFCPNCSSQSESFDSKNWRVTQVCI